MQKERISLFAGSALLLILGIVLIIWPEFSLNVIVYGLSAAVTLFGIVKLIMYFVRKNQRQYMQMDLMEGVIACVAGILLIPRLVIWMSIVPIIVGLVIIASGIGKIMNAVECKKRGYPMWWAVLTMAVVSILLGGVILVNPFSTIKLTVRVIGAVLVLDNAENVWSMVMFQYRLKKDGYVVVDSGDDDIIDVIQKH